MIIQVTQNLQLFLDIAEVISTGLRLIPEEELKTLCWSGELAALVNDQDAGRVWFNPVEFFTRIKPEVQQKLLPRIIELYNEQARRQDPVGALMVKAMDETREAEDAAVFAELDTSIKKLEEKKDGPE